MALIGDFLKALAQCGDRRFLMVLAKSLGLTVVLLLGLTFVTGWLVSFIPTDLGEWWLIGQVTLPTAALQGLAVSAVIFASSFLMIPVAALFVGFFLEDVADAVEVRHYPHAGMPRKIAMGETLVGALRFFGVIVGVNLLALIPYLIFLFILPPVALALIYGVNGYLLGREYFEMVAARHLSGKDTHALRTANRWRVWLAGVLMAIPLTIPIMNLVVPVLGVATITHQFHRLRVAAG